jgi:hypothetical protein
VNPERIMLAAVLLTLAAAPVPKTEAADWKSVINDREFMFDPDRKGLLNAVSDAKRAGLSAETRDLPGGFSRIEFEFTVSHKDGPKLAIAAHADSAVVIRGDALYFAEFSPIASGCRVVAYDLTTGKKAWVKDLEGLGPIDHSKYRNKVAMAVEKHPTAKDAFALVITGWEAAGAYYEVIDLATGKQLAIKQFDYDVAGLPRP